MARFYTLDSAATTLVEIRPLLERLRDDARRLQDSRDELVRLRRLDGAPGAAATADERERELRNSATRIRESVERLEELDIQLRDVESGLIDFPALVTGRPIWLCWRFGEDEIGWWHEVNVGFSGRRPLIELE